MPIQKFASIQDFYKFLDDFSDKLLKNSLPELGQRIQTLIHKVKWTTSSELLEELGKTLNQVDKSKLSSSLQNDIDICINAVQSYLGR